MPNLQSHAPLADDIVSPVCSFVKEGSYGLYLLRIRPSYCLYFDILEIKYCVELVKSKSLLAPMLSAVFGFIGIQELVRHVVLKKTFKYNGSVKKLFYIEDPKKFQRRDMFHFI